MKNTKIIDKIYASNTPLPVHLRGNVLEIKNTSDKNYNLKVGNTLVSPVCSVDSFSALEKESNGRIGTLGIVASQSTRSRTGAITDIIPSDDDLRDEDWQSYPLIPIGDIQLSSSINLSDEEWDTLRAAHDANDDDLTLYYAGAMSDESAAQILYLYMHDDTVDGGIVEMAPGVNIQLSSGIILGHLIYNDFISGVNYTAMFVTPRNGNSASMLMWGNDDVDVPSMQVGSSFKDTIKLFMQKVPNFGLQVSTPVNSLEQLAHKIVNLLIPSVTALTFPSLEGVYIRNTNSWDTVVTSKNIASMLPRMEHVDATNEIPDLKWGTCYDIYFDDNAQDGLGCTLPYRDSAIAPDQLLMIRIALKPHFQAAASATLGLLFSNYNWIHWINDRTPNTPANMPNGDARGVLNIIVCAFGVGYTYWTND